MDPFESPHWSRLQVEIWVCTRSRDAVKLADCEPGSIRFTDLSLGPDRVDDEAQDDGDDLPVFASEGDLISDLIFQDYIRSLEDLESARRKVIVAVGDGQLKSYSDSSGPLKQFFKRSDVLRLWDADATNDSEVTQSENGLSSGNHLSTRASTRGFKLDDKPLLGKMDQLLESRECSSPWAAAMEVAPEARGGGTVESKAKRLHRQFQPFRVRNAEKL